MKYVMMAVASKGFLFSGSNRMMVGSVFRLWSNAHGGQSMVGTARLWPETGYPENSEQAEYQTASSYAPGATGISV